MKNKFKIMLGLFAMAASVLTVQAQTFNTENFLTGTNLFVQPSTTNGIGASVTNIYNYNPQTVVTNSVISVNTFTTPYTYTTNFVNVTNSYSGTTNFGGFRDVNLWANRDGSPLTANLSIHLTGLDPSATNLITATVIAIPAGGDVGNLLPSTIASTELQNQFTFALTNRGSADVVLATNLPTAFLQGSGSLRAKITSSAGTNILVRSFRLNGWTP